MKPQIIRHGEVLLKPIKGLPQEAKLIEEKNDVIVAHSETGHHHHVRTLDRTKGANVRVYEVDGKHYLDIGEKSELYHQKTGADTHAPHVLEPAIYEVIIKKSFNYFSKKMERVID